MLRYVVLLAAVGTLALSCSENRCKRPHCSCFTTDPPNGLKRDDVPQFVMFSFDDGVNVVNYNDTYVRLFTGSRKNKANGCHIAATFFVTHEYTDYSLVNKLYRHGNEIAVHSITHVADVERWKKASYSIWEKEMVGMRQIASRFAKIPESAINGSRAPFLQTAGDTTFSMLRNEGFLYDSSMPTLRSTPPAWPYTLDFGYEQGCQIEPCPDGTYKGLWEVPLVNYFSIATPDFTCSMADACTPYPTTEAATFAYFRTNFERHYNSNRAPFPVFLHEAWLKNAERKKGYIRFIDWLLEKNDVYLVTVQTVVEYMKNPVEKNSYRQRACMRDHSIMEDNCPSPTNCLYKDLEQFWGGSRYMKVCTDECPRKFPWLDNLLGE